MFIAKSQHTSRAFTVTLAFTSLYSHLCQLSSHPVLKVVLISLVSVCVWVCLSVWSSVWWLLNRVRRHRDIFMWARCGQGLDEWARCDQGLDECILMQCSAWVPWCDVLTWDSRSFYKLRFIKWTRWCWQSLCWLNYDPCSGSGAAIVFSSVVSLCGCVWWGLFASQHVEISSLMLMAAKYGQKLWRVWKWLHSDFTASELTV